MTTEQNEHGGMIPEMEQPEEGLQEIPTTEKDRYQDVINENTLKDQFPDWKNKDDETLH